MNEITKSASKIVFILMALGSIAALFTGKITGDQFMILTVSAFSFYYANKGETKNAQGEPIPYAGK